jgi:hypothetical protein
MIKIFCPKFLKACDNLLETIHGQHTQRIKSIERGFIGNVITYSNFKLKRK